MLPPQDVRALRAKDRDRLHVHLPTVARWAEEVGALGLPTTLVHNDLHGNNVFAVDGELRFFDFADAMLMEPLAALLIPLDLLAFRLDAGPDDARLRRVADAALEVWSDVADPVDLRAAPAGRAAAGAARPHRDVGALHGPDGRRRAGGVGERSGHLARRAAARSAGGAPPGVSPALGTAS